MNAALRCRSVQQHSREADDAQFLALPVEEACLHRSRRNQEALPIVGILDVVDLTYGLATFRTALLCKRTHIISACWFPAFEGLTAQIHSTEIP